MSITVDSIIEKLEQLTADNQVIDIDRLLNAASKLNILLGEEHNKLFDLHQKVSQETSKLIEEGYSVAKARMSVEGSEVYKEMSKQKARIGRIEEFIRISKLQAKLKAEELRNQ